MDRAAIEELFAFTDYSWREHERTIRPLGDEGLTEPAGTSDEPVERVKSWDELVPYRRRVRGHAREYLDSLGGGELLTPREMNVDGETLLYSPADIFVNVLLHERQHHGDVNTLLYQLGVEAPIVEYRFSLPGNRPESVGS